MDKVERSYEYSTPGAAGLSVMSFVLAIVGFLHVFLPFFSGVQKMVLFVMAAFILWVSWVTKCSAEIKMRIDQEGVRIRQKRTGEEHITKWDDISVVYRIPGAKGVITYVFAVDVMSKTELNKLFKKSWKNPLKVWPCHGGNIWIGGHFHDKMIESYFPEGMRVEDVPH